MLSRLVKEGIHPASNQKTAPFILPDLPYTHDSLAPHMSKETLSFHHGKHHQAYVNTLNGLISGTAYATGQTLESVITTSAGKADEATIFNNAAQVWNHSFFWHGLSPQGGGEPTHLLRTQIERDFGSVQGLYDALKQAALSQFGSGWAWLVWRDGTLSVTKTGNADTPWLHGLVPLWTVDVWEHAYYLDYQNRRADYVMTIITHLMAWPMIEAQWLRLQ